MRVRLNKPDNTGSYSTWSCLSLCGMKELLTCVFLTFWAKQSSPWKPQPSMATQGHLFWNMPPSFSVLLPPSISLHFLFSFFLTLSVGLTERTSNTTRWLTMHHSSSLLCTAHDLLRGWDSLHSVYVCVHVQHSFSLACWGTNTLWLKLSSSSHLVTPWHTWRKWEQRDEESEGHQAVVRGTYVCVFLHASMFVCVCVCPVNVINSSVTNSGRHL